MWVLWLIASIILAIIIFGWPLVFKEEFKSKKEIINSKMNELNNEMIKLKKEYIKSNVKYPIGSKVCITTPASTNTRLGNLESVTVPEIKQYAYVKDYIIDFF